MLALFVKRAVVAVFTIILNVMCLRLVASQVASSAAEQPATFNQHSTAASVYVACAVRCVSWFDHADPNCSTSGLLQ
jgi:hypothetical protein